MKRVLLCWLICAFVISSVSVCFANDTEDARQSRTERAGIVEDVTGTDYIADNYLEERDVIPNGSCAANTKVDLVKETNILNQHLIEADSKKNRIIGSAIKSSYHEDKILRAEELYE